MAQAKKEVEVRFTNSEMREGNVGWRSGKLFRPAEEPVKT
jgi:hypothetical protein